MPSDESSPGSIPGPSPSGRPGEETLAQGRDPSAPPTRVERAVAALTGRARSAVRSRRRRAHRRRAHRRRAWLPVAGPLVVLLGVGAAVVTALGSNGDQVSAAAHRRACVQAHDVPQRRRISDTTTVYRRCVWPRPPGAAPDGFVHITRTTYRLPQVVRRGSFVRVSVFTSPCRRYSLVYTQHEDGYDDSVGLTDLSRRQIVSAYDGQPVDVIGRPSPPVESRGGGLVVMEGARHMLTAVSCGRGNG